MFKTKLLQTSTGKSRNVVRMWEQKNCPSHNKTTQGATLKVGDVKYIEEAVKTVDDLVAHGSLNNNKSGDVGHHLGLEAQ